MAFELLRPLYDHGGKQQSRRRVLDDGEVRALALRRAGALGKAARQAAALLFDDPAALRERFARLLEAYWEEAFEAEWRRIEPKLADGIASAGRTVARGGVYSFLLQLAPALRVDPAAQTFGLDIPHDHRVVLGADNPLLLIPSAYVWPHVRVNCDGPWPLTIAYRAPYLVEGLRPVSAPELERSLHALAAPTRLRILRLVAERPRSTQEVASLAAVSEVGGVEAPPAARVGRARDAAPRGVLRRVLAGAGRPSRRSPPSFAHSAEREPTKRTIRSAISSPLSSCRK